MQDAYLDEGGQEVDEHDEAHGEAAKSAQLLQGRQLQEVVDGGVDPATALGQEDGPALRRHRQAHGVLGETGLHVGEMLEQQGGEVPVLPQVQEVLLVQRVHRVLMVLGEQVLGHQDGRQLPVLQPLQAVDGEAAWEAGDRPEQRLEGLGQVVADGRRGGVCVCVWVWESGVRGKGISTNTVHQPLCLALPPNTPFHTHARTHTHTLPYLIKYSYTWIMVMTDWFWLEMRVSPHRPMILVSWVRMETNLLRASRSTYVSASTMSTNS
jgi:hypothetical protein